MLRKVLSTVFLFSISVAAQVSTGKQYPIDMNHSNVGFSVPIMNGLSKVKGKFTDFTVTLNNDEKDITKSTVNVVIKATSIDTGIEGRDKHLRTADFFDVEKYPEITFQSSRIEKRGKQFIAHGTFTMHGVAKEIALPFTVTGVSENSDKTKKTIGYSASIVLNRREFGINWSHRTVPNFVGDNITVDIDLITRAVDVK
ncbi:MAG TPA: YceI family protein [Pyrinomonadaceae bacterium]|jgi:polyisoprenoid-binding protein YceI|nr:YceI family protein [Pyrinomonadaceae bacterium]